jgi:peroxiredoxin
MTPTVEESAKIGAPAPAFTLPDVAGKSHNLSDFAGKYVVLEWTNYGCPYVVRHYKDGHMQSLQAKAKEKGVVWLSVVSSAPGTQGYVTAETGTKLFADQGFKSAGLLLDPAGTVGKTYGAKTTPHMYVIDPKGVLIYNGAIDSIRSADAADNAKATNYVMQALEESMAGKPVSVPTTQPYGCSVKYAG